MRDYTLKILLIILVIIWNNNNNNGLLLPVKAQNQTSPSAAPSPSPSPSATPTTPTTPTPATTPTATPATPTTGSRGRGPLRITVPVSTYKEFVNIKTDAVTGEDHISGFSVEVFQAVVNTAMSDPPEFTLVPFAKPDGSFNGSFDLMLKAVFNQEYDGAVGDTTIRFDRSSWVDFTLPYSDTGITMMVSSNQKSNRRTGIKLMPLIKGLVSAALAFCFISALIFWFVEFRNDKNRHSQQPPIGSNNNPGHRANSDDYWKRETLRAIIHTRLVIVMWFLVLLFITSCYAASLSSLLTAQRQKRPIKTLDELIRKRAKVGIQKGSFVPRLLIQRGFTEDQIQTYDTEDEMIDMLSKGNAPGGVAVVVDETPYLKVFISKNCNKGYSLVPSFDLHAQGFGFAFQRGSPLVREISNGILKLMDKGQLTTIQKRTIGDLDEACQEDLDDDANVDNFLDFDTMWILLAGAIGVAILVVVLYMVYLGTTCDTIRKRLVYPCYLIPNYQGRKN